MSCIPMIEYFLNIMAQITAIKWQKKSHSDEWPSFNADFDYLVIVIVQLTVLIPSFAL